MTQPDPADGSPQPPAASIRDMYRTQLLQGLGGWSGTVIAAIPTVVFVIVNSVASLRVAIYAAVGSAVVLTGYRLVRRQSVQQALSGLFGVAIAVLIAYRTGQARGYFLYGILTSFGYAAAVVVTVVIRRPAVGLVWEFLDPSPHAGDEPPVPWYRRRALLLAYDLASGLAALIFLARALVQLVLYNRDDTGWLAVARIAMGYPLTILAIGFGLWVVNRARRAVAAAAAAGQEQVPAPD